MPRPIHLFAIAILVSAGFLSGMEIRLPLGGAPAALAGGCGSDAHVPDRDAGDKEDNLDAGSGESAASTSRQAWRLKRAMTRAERKYQKRKKRIKMALRSWWDDEGWRKVHLNVSGDFMTPGQYVDALADYVRSGQHARLIRSLPRRVYNRLVLKMAMVEGTYGGVISRFKRMLSGFDADARLKERLQIIVNSAARLSAALDRYVSWKSNERKLGRRHVATVDAKKAWDTAYAGLSDDEKQALKSGGPTYMGNYSSSYRLRQS